MELGLLQSTFRQFIKYALVGGIGTTIQTTVLVILVELTKMSPFIATCIGFSCSLIISYYINKKWTFSNRDVKSMAFLKYFIVSCSGLLLNLLILHVLVNIFSVWYIWVQMVIIVVVPLSNFFLNKFWTF